MSAPIPPTQITKAETFILESLSEDDELNQRLDGKVLYEVLRLQGKKPVYYYFRTQTELIRFSDIFTSLVMATIRSYYSHSGKQITIFSPQSLKEN